ncbi:MAG TPA: PEP-utilizing enzyme [Anaerolineales bacterium]|nr:PEP-utilizing enzyme [Anaerolineales bacterium]
MNAEVITRNPDAEQERLILPPADFPVTWINSDDGIYHWTRDCEHNPAPITPMFSSFAAHTAGEGRRRTVELYKESILGRLDRQINTYNYTRLIAFTGSPKEIAEREKQNRQIVGAVSARLAEAWENEWKPELDALWSYWRAFDLKGASWDDLATHFEGTLTRATRIYEIHYLMGPPMWYAIDEFEKLFCDLFAGSTALDAHRLLQGFDNKTLEIGRALWRLSRDANDVEDVRKALLELPAGEVIPVLQQSVNGVYFLARFYSFLQAYGRRSDLWDWGYPSWEEDPTPLLNNLKNYLAQPERDLESELAEAAQQREAAISRARQELDYYPQPVRERFETLLKAAQIALVLTEDHTFYIDFNGFGWVRRVIRELGKRLTDRMQLYEPNDVFFIELAELRHAIADPTLNLCELAEIRRVDTEQWAKRPGPKELGTRPAKPLYVYSPDARRMLRYIGGFVAESKNEYPEPGILRGQAGSSGKVCGPARVILTLADAHRLKPGDILVTTTTAPPWTPLFLTAAGLVTDAGGLLSHGAVVSREYRIPAVVGTRDATTMIQDGQLIEVDGNGGMVRLL